MLAIPLAVLLACAPKTAPLTVPAPTTPGAGSDVDAGLPPEPMGELVTDGTLDQRLSGIAADLVVLYGSEHKGSMETCGCPKRPRGSLSRLDAYADAVTARAPTVRVHGGHWLADGTDFDGRVRPDVLIQDRTMIGGMQAVSWDAVNVSVADLAGLLTLGADSGADALQLVSANVRGNGIATHRVMELGGLRIGFTGIAAETATLAELPPGSVLEPVAAATPVLEQLSKEADVIVLLSYMAPEAARTLQKRFPAIDVVVDTAQHREYLAPVRVQDTLWVYSHYQTMRVGELRLDLRNGRVVGAVDRKVDLDPSMPDDAGLLTLQKAARTEIDAAQQALYGAAAP
jgi:2',3'-cyclic-nucleotide 2'-phosphodiesterase (5'-nucleotidase family)